MLKRHLHSHVYCSILHNIQEVETGRIDWENVAYIHDGTLFGYKKNEILSRVAT
jgi:hypothetical protein